LPIDIEQALHEATDKLATKDLQSLAFAHIEADRWAKQQSLDQQSLLPFERGEAPRLTGLNERTARDVLGRLVDEGFLLSDSPKGKVRVGFPVHALGSLLPNLYPAGDVDISAEQLKQLVRAIKDNALARNQLSKKLGIK
jgi:hypothetical protein